MAHETVLTIFIIIAAAAIVLQALAMFGIYTAIRRLQGEVSSIRAEVLRRLDPLTQSVTDIVTDTREPLRTVMSNLVEVSRALREGTNSVDAVLDELLDKFRLQVVRFDETITDLLEKIEKTTTTVQRNIIGPVTEVSAILKGLQVGLDFFLSRRRSSRTSDVPQDEQMFI
jgi:methyl-accepting chemotaxis protein